ncbi:MAG: RNA methyltransferase [Candidatus Aminicenantes bacterium]|nr:RNA methyltransferase [Candidatus Aminicenantes bacterium]
MTTPERLARIKSVLGFRQPDLRIVLERIDNPHNASAVLRTCDAAGIMAIDVIGSGDDPMPINNAITTRADKWLKVDFHPTTEACLAGLKKQGFAVAVTHLGPDSVPYTSLDFTRPTAVVFGGERDGISEAALVAADHKIKIPMFGMVQSLNLSVSVGIIVYEAIRQRLGSGFFDNPRLSPAELEDYLDRWSDL